MNDISKQKFLAELGKLLTFMYEEDRQTALAMYTKMFDDAPDEQALTQALASPTRQAVLVARAYNAKERKLQVHAQSREEGGEAVERETTPEFVLVIDQIYQSAMPRGDGNGEPLVNQVSLFEESSPEDFVEPEASVFDPAAAPAEPEAPRIWDEEAHAQEAPELEAIPAAPLVSTLVPEPAPSLPETPEADEAPEAGMLTAAEPEPIEAESAESEDAAEDLSPAEPELDEAPGAEEVPAAEEEPAPPAEDDLSYITEDEDPYVTEDETPYDAEDGSAAEPEDAPEEGEALPEDAEALPLEEPADYDEEELPETDELLPQRLAAEELSAEVETAAPGETRLKARPLLLIPFLILAIPLTAVAVAVLLIPTLLFMALAIVTMAAGAGTLIGAFSGFPVFADLLVVLGAALIILALGLLFLWVFIWFIGGAIVGLIRWVAGLCRQCCFKEVAV